MEVSPKPHQWQIPLHEGLHHGLWEGNMAELLWESKGGLLPHAGEGAEHSMCSEHILTLWALGHVGIFFGGGEMPEAPLSRIPRAWKCHDLALWPLGKAPGDQGNELGCLLPDATQPLLPPAVLWPWGVQGSTWLGAEALGHVASSWGGPCCWCNSQAFVQHLLEVQPTHQGFVHGFWGRCPQVPSVHHTKSSHEIAAALFTQHLGDSRLIENIHQHGRDLCRASKSNSMSNVSIMANVLRCGVLEGRKVPMVAAKEIMKATGMAWHSKNKEPVVQKLRTHGKKLPVELQQMMAPNKKGNEQWPSPSPGSLFQSCCSTDWLFHYFSDQAATDADVNSAWLSCLARPGAISGTTIHFISGHGHCFCRVQLLGCGHGGQSGLDIGKDLPLCCEAGFHWLPPHHRLGWLVGVAGGALPHHSRRN